jgi:hypothetical protein
MSLAGPTTESFSHKGCGSECHVLPKMLRHLLRGSKYRNDKTVKDRKICDTYLDLVQMDAASFYVLAG